MGGINSTSQKKTKVPSYPMHYLLSEDQACSLWPWCNCQSHVQGHAWTIGISYFFSNLEQVQLANSSIQYLVGVVESLLVNVKGSHFFTDFMVLDMQDDGEMPLIPGWSFLSDVSARIDVGTWKIRFHIGRSNLTFKLQAGEQQCYIVQNDVEQLGGKRSHIPNQSNHWLHLQNQRKQRKCGGR
jgi:hypothetical protein